MLTQGPVSISEKTSFRKISPSLEAARFVFRIVRSLWNLTGTSAAVLPMCLSNFKTIRQFKVPISWLLDFTRSYEKTSFRILRRVPDLLSTYGVTRPQWVDLWIALTHDALSSDIFIHHIFLVTKKGKKKNTCCCRFHCNCCCYIGHMRQQLSMWWAIMIKFCFYWCMSQHLKSVKPICDIKMKMLKFWLIFQRMYIHYLLKVPCGAVKHDQFSHKH